MSINFNALPVNKPTNLPEAGRYYATIEDAVMRNSNDITKPRYLNLTLALKNSKGVSCGKIYDIISESDKPLVQFKVARFIIALHLETLGEFELSDLTKIVKGKQVIVDVKQEDAKDGFPAKAVVDPFKGNIYYPIEEAKSLFTEEESSMLTKTVQATSNTESSNDELKISAEDAADASVPFATDAEESDF